MLLEVLRSENWIIRDEGRKTAGKRVLNRRESILMCRSRLHHAEHDSVAEEVVGVLLSQVTEECGVWGLGLVIVEGSCRQPGTAENGLMTPRSLSPQSRMPRVAFHQIHQKDTGCGI